MTDSNNNVPTQLQPMSYGESERRMQGVAKRIRLAEKAYTKSVEDAATAEALYRKALGDKFKALREAGTAVEAAMTQARGELWQLSRERDIASGRVRLRLEQLDNRRGERASLHKLVDWSGGIDVIERRAPAKGHGPTNGDDY
jgi:chromosome segregation ATPase